MKAISYLLLAFILVIGSACNTTTQQSRESALATKRLVADFRKLQVERLNELNNDYQTEYQKLIKELTRLTWKEVEQGFDAESVRLSDGLALEWKKQTQPGKIADALHLMLKTDYEKLRKAEASLDEIRKNYGEKYKDVALQLGALERIEKNLDTLSKTPRQNREFAEAIRLLYEAHRKTSEERENKETESASEAPKSP